MADFLKKYGFSMAKKGQTSTRIDYPVGDYCRWLNPGQSKSEDGSVTNKTSHIFLNNDLIGKVKAFTEKPLKDMPLFLNIEVLDDPDEKTRIVPEADLLDTTGVPSEIDSNISRYIIQRIAEKRLQIGE